MKKIIFPVVIGIIIALFVYKAVDREEKPILPDAPAWTLLDTNGNSVSLSDYKGKPLILHFWATWCPYCKKIQPALNTIYESHKQEGLVLLGISWWEDEGAQPQQVLIDRGFQFKTLLEGDEVAKLYGIKGTPATFFINKKGKIIYASNSSDPDDPRLAKAVEVLLND